MWNRKDLLGLEELTKDEIETVLDTAESFREISLRPIKKVPALRGKTVVNLFFEPSTRTRISFELAAKRLSADIINITADTSSLKKGETLIDMARNLDALKADIIVMRHPSSGAGHLIANRIRPCVINAGDGSHEHPTQALLDIFTIKRIKHSIKGLKVCLVGDIAHSRVARSNIWGLVKLGAKVTVCGPATLVPKYIEKMGVCVRYDLVGAIKDTDVVMALRIQHERQESGLITSIKEFSSEFGLNEDKLKFAKKDAIIMHPGPLNRGVELTSDIADGKSSVILEQVTNGLAVRMAVLYLCANYKSNE